MIPFKKSSVLNLKIIFLFLCILPFFLLTFFARPSADEFPFFTQLSSMSSLEFASSMYKNWSGRYFSVFFVSIFLKLIVYWKGFYPIFIFLILVANFFSFYWMIDKLNFTNSKKEKLLLTSSIFIVYIYGMPSLAEGFYWFICASGYMLINCFVIFWTGFLLEREYKIDNSKPIFRENLLIIFFTFALCGSMEIISSFVVGLIAVVWLTKLINTKKADNFYSFLFLFAFFCFCFSVFAGGNSIRGTHFESLSNPLLILPKLIPNSLNYIFYWFFETPVLVFTLFYLPFAQKIVTRSPFDFILKVNRFWVLLVWIGVIFGSFSIGYVSIGGELPMRINNIVYFLFLTGWFYVVSVFVYFYINENSNPNYSSDFSIFKNASVFTKLIAPLVIFLFLYKENNPIRAAYADILKGRAYNYAMQLDDRKTLLLNCKSDTCIVPVIKNPPHIIYEPALDLTTDSNDWKNKSQAVYFGVKAIKVE
ncbi:DUF6056 family protein [Bernardetia sp. Wsw4-3y2]|uniref:DUF6056 family protein n=1 Tax=Bernardetia sp. Wsw4-3y2 TaxID=3127471 RepID=UPI0030CDA8C9